MDTDSYEILIVDYLERFLKNPSSKRELQNAAKLALHRLSGTFSEEDGKDLMNRYAKSVGLRMELDPIYGRGEDGSRTWDFYPHPTQPKTFALVVPVADIDLMKNAQDELIRYLGPRSSALVSIETKREGFPVTKRFY